VKKCALPLTGKRCVSALCTDLCWIDISPDGPVLRELAPGATVESVQNLTEPRLIVAPDLRTMKV
jgi:3-oxoacid CoA-transferase subunit B